MRRKWTEIKKILGNVLSESQQKVWIAPLHAHLQGETLCVYAPTEFIASFVRNRFMPYLAEAAGAVLGDGVSINILFDPQQHLQQKSSVQSESHQLEAHETDTPASLKKKELKVKKCSTSSKDAEGVTGPFALSPELIQNSFVPRPMPHEQLGLPIPMPEARGYDYFSSWRFSFDDFLVGDCNELAYASAKTLCTGYTSPDVLFLNSAPGLGKTHLVHAVGKYLSAKTNRATAKVEYVTAEEFTTGFLRSLESRNTDTFKARYRTLDLLLLEDVHFFQGKKGTQAELLATMNALQGRGAKVVFTSSFAPKDLKGLDEQLISRLSAGFMTNIAKPDMDMRRRLFRHKASLHQVALPEDVENLLAEHIDADIRQIESCLQNLILKAKLLRSGITMAMAWDVIGNYGHRATSLDINGIISQVCQAFNLTRQQLASASRKQEYVTARNMVFFLARKHTDLSLEAIGQQCNRRHSTVLKGLTKFEREMGAASPYGSQVSNIIAMIEKNSGPTTLSLR